MAIRMQIIEHNAMTSLSFPDHEEGSRLRELGLVIADAISGGAPVFIGNPLEGLVKFEGYPDEFALYWDGFTCALGCDTSCSIDMHDLADRLVATELFELIMTNRH